MNNKSVKVIFSKKVRGKDPRSYIQQKATKLNLKGYVRIMLDQSLEVCACGEKNSLDNLITFLKELLGDEAGNTTEITWDNCQIAENRFTIKHSSS